MSIASVRQILNLAAAAALLLSQGCASTSPPVAKHMEPVVPGTVTTFHRKSSGSLGVYDGQVVWDHSLTTWQGKPVLAATTRNGGGNLFDRATHGMIAVTGAEGKPVITFEPPIDYQWPVAVGKTWTSSHTVTQMPSGRQSRLEIQWKVEAYEEVTVPAGTFKAYRVTWSNQLGEVETRWFSPSAGLSTIKRQVQRPASHPQGAGLLEGHLLSVVKPKP